MALNPELPIEERLVHLFQHLGIDQAHIAARMASDWQGLATVHPDLIASLTLVCPPPMDPRAVQPLASRLLVVTGDQGPAAERVRQQLTNLPGATSVTLREYVSLIWSDVIAERTADIGAALLEFLQHMDQRHQTQAVRLPAREGDVAGVSYRIRGAGPPLVLLPLDLAPSQWEPLLPTLSARYCTITLGGAAVGTVASLEARGRSGYLSVVRRLLEAVRVQPGEVVLEVGCGSGVVIREVARQTGGPTASSAWTSTPICSVRRRVLPSRRGLARESPSRKAMRERSPSPSRVSTSPWPVRSSRRATPTGCWPSWCG
jgi:hypothetical protein